MKLLVMPIVLLVACCAGFSYAQETPLESVVAPSQSTKAAPAPIILQQRKVPEDYVPSFANRKTSVVFSPSEAAEIMQLLDDTERTLASGGTLTPIVIEGKDAGESSANTAAVQEPLPSLNFPVFYVSSILYHSASDWMLWVNGQRVTPKRKLEGIVVAHVGPEQVTLDWTPDNWKYRAQVWSGKATLSKELTNIISQGAKAEPQHGRSVLRATMRANQTFVTAGPLIVEGNHPEYALTVQAQAMQPVQTASATDAAIVPAAFSGDQVKDMLNKVAKEKDAQRKEQQAKQATQVAKDNAAAAPVTAAAIPMPAAAPDVSAVAQNPAPSIAMPTPNTLDDILNAVGSAAPTPQP